MAWRWSRDAAEKNWGVTGTWLTGSQNRRKSVRRSARVIAHKSVKDSKRHAF
jgi:hypothetical protein